MVGRRVVRARVEAELLRPWLAAARPAAGPWYHATSEVFEPGAELLPGDSVGSHAQGRYSDGSRVWVSNDPVRASAYGFHVYEVEPHDEPRSPHGNDEHHTSGARVLREVPEADINSWRRGYDPSVGWRGAGRRVAGGGPIYRGLSLRLSPAERSRITGLFASDPQAASDALLDLVSRGGGDEPTGGAGRHWSEDEGVARGFAGPASSVAGPGDDVEGARSLGVVLRGLRPAVGEDAERTNSGYEHTPLPGERLVSLLPGTDVELTGLGLGNVAPSEDADGWVYADSGWHDLPATRRLRAERLYRGIPLGGEGDVDLDALAGGVGVHWSPRRDVAENFANWGSSEEDLAAFAAAGHPFRPVVVEAEWDGAGRDPGGVSGGMPLFDDDEVVLRAGTPLDVRSVRGRGGELLVEPRRMRAAQDRARAVETRLPTPEVMGYFHSVITPEDVPAALAADVRANGVREPIEIVTDGVRAAIADGHHRALSAEGGGLPSVPVRVFRVGPDAMLGGRGGVLGGELATALGHRVSFRLGWFEKDPDAPGNWALPLRDGEMGAYPRLGGRVRGVGLGRRSVTGPSGVQGRRAESSDQRPAVEGGQGRQRLPRHTSTTWGQESDSQCSLTRDGGVRRATAPRHVRAALPRSEQGELRAVEPELRHALAERLGHGGPRLAQQRQENALQAWARVHAGEHTPASQWESALPVLPSGPTWFKPVAGLRFELGPPDEGKWAYAIEDEARDGLATGETLAELCWDGDTGEVNWIETYKGHRRRGIARDLFHWVRNNHQSDLHHSDELSEDGRAFAEAVAALRVARRLLRGF